MMDKVLFLAHVPLSDDERQKHSKLFYQMSALEHMGFGVDYIGSDGKYFWFCPAGCSPAGPAVGSSGAGSSGIGSSGAGDSDTGSPAGAGRVRLCRGRNSGAMSRLSFFRAVKKALRLTEGCGCAYVRAEPFVPQFLSVLKLIKKKNMRIVLEIPTYPFFQELRGRGAAAAVLSVVGRLVARRLSACVDLVAAFCDDREIFGIPVANVENGIDCGAVPLRREGFHGDELHLLALANMTPSHGYDRLIEGLKDYCAAPHSVKIYLHLAGRGGGCLDEWMALARRYGLQKYVIYHGERYGRELEELFDKCDLGVAALGMYRKGMEDGSNLKVREYCARGLPFVCAYRERAIGGGEGFAKRFPNTPAPIDMQELLAFYESVRAVPDIGGRMRAFVLEHYTWEKQFEKIFGVLAATPQPSARLAALRGQRRQRRRNIVKRLARASIFKSIRYSLRFGLIVLVGRGSRIRAGRGAKILKKGFATLDVGVYWGYPCKAFLQIMEGGTLTLTGPVHFCEGSRVIVGRGASLEVGARTYINVNAAVWCKKRVSIGQNCAVSWNATIMDTDGHAIAAGGRVCDEAKEVALGEHVLVGCGAVILKGVSVGDNSVVAAGAVVTRSVPENCMAAGSPARVVKTGVSWDGEAISREIKS